MKLPTNSRARYLVRDDAGRYVERLYQGGYVAAAWTVYPSAARSFGLNVARAVASRNFAHVVSSLSNLQNLPV